jgi:hypothetical protein
MAAINLTVIAIIFIIKIDELNLGVPMSAFNTRCMAKAAKLNTEMNTAVAEKPINSCFE